MLCAISSGKSQETLREDSLSVQWSPTEKKGEGCDKFDAVLTISQTHVKSLHTGRGSEGRVSWYTAYCILRNSYATRCTSPILRTPSHTSPISSRHTEKTGLWRGQSRRPDVQAAQELHIHSTTQIFSSQDNDNDNDNSSKVFQQWSEAWSEGVITPQKRI